MTLQRNPNSHHSWGLAFAGTWVHLTYPNLPPFPQMTPFTPSAPLTAARAGPLSPSRTPSAARGLPHGTLLTQLLPSHDTLNATEAQPSKQTDSFSPMSSLLGRLLRCPHPPTTGLQTNARNTVSAYEGVTNGRDMCVKSLPCPSELASRSQRRSACRSWDWGYTALHTAAWEAWEQPADRE